jgi:hypothetical protein
MKKSLLIAVLLQISSYAWAVAPVPIDLIVPEASAYSCNDAQASAIPSSDQDWSRVFIAVKGASGIYQQTGPGAYQLSTAMTATAPAATITLSGCEKLSESFF